MSGRQWRSSSRSGSSPPRRRGRPGRPTAWDGANPVPLRAPAGGHRRDVARPGRRPVLHRVRQAPPERRPSSASSTSSRRSRRASRAAVDKCFYFQSDHWRGSVSRTTARPRPTSGTATTSSTRPRATAACGSPTSASTAGPSTPARSPGCRRSTPSTSDPGPGGSSRTTRSRSTPPASRRRPGSRRTPHLRRRVARRAARRPPVTSVRGIWAGRPGHGRDEGLGRARDPPADPARLPALLPGRWRQGAGRTAGRPQRHGRRARPCPGAFPADDERAAANLRATSGAAAAGAPSCVPTRAPAPGSSPGHTRVLRLRPGLLAGVRHGRARFVAVYDAAHIRRARAVRDWLRRSR